LYVVGGRTAGMAANVDANEVYDPIKDIFSLRIQIPHVLLFSEAICLVTPSRYQD
jgi:hypothetical protein